MPKKIPAPVSSDFFEQYLKTALWSSTNMDDDRPFEYTHNVDDFSDKALTEASQDCNDFIEANEADLNEAGGDMGQHGHDFWLTRNGHGAGFWDRGYGAVGERLSKASKVYGEVNIYVGDDGKLHFG